MSIAGSPEPFQDDEGNGPTATASKDVYCTIVYSYAHCSIPTISSYITQPLTLLQSEVATLAEATAKQQAAMVTPFLIPDAHTLCTGLHLVKKLLKTEKFVVVIAKSGTHLCTAL